MRRSAGTPDTGLNRLAAIKESSTYPYSSQDYSAHLSQHRPYSRRSIVLDEDDSRSVISNMSEDGESCATSAADLADLRGLYDYERPESACSYSSDMSRSMGKPPTVPPKSEKALQRAKRLTTRRIKKDISKTVADSPVELRSLFRKTPIFLPPLRYAPTSAELWLPLIFPHLSPSLMLQQRGLAWLIYTLSTNLLTAMLLPMPLVLSPSQLHHLMPMPPFPSLLPRLMLLALLPTLLLLRQLLMFLLLPLSIMPNTQLQLQ
ncbi:hypothetical protein KUCAC02_024274 [Chaenocephalus aceratus]|uniref:Uncharacterized protein n=1 Tax=Chaenocephalus aceratus TaxID=36190 RepID=A0ACB9WIA2_CHAAC|nr:hypothetical protein KUCAC02_024274 [Chaenocephalus aceratus]